jgi:cobalt/nickel transport system permease protein
VVADDLRRMRIARASRGEVGAGARLTAVAAGAGTLFVRSYERGERVHHAMLARGYTGRLPAAGGTAATPGQWLTAALLPAGATVVVVSTLLLGG